MLEVQASLYHYYLSNLTRLIALIRAHSPLKLTSCHQHKQIKEGIKNQTSKIISSLTFDLAAWRSKKPAETRNSSSEFLVVNSNSSKSSN